jgi:hypothetical protein
MKDWVADVKKADILTQQSQFRKTIHMHREMPFPLSDREFIVCSTSLLVKERKGAMILIRSANDDRKKHWEISESILPPLQDNIVRGEMIKGFIYVEHIDSESCWFHGYINMNPRIQFMPDSFMNFVLKKIVGVMVKKI